MSLRPAMLSILLAAVVVTSPAAADAADRAHAVEVPAVGAAAFVGFANFDRRISTVTFAPGTDPMARDDVTFAMAPATLEPAAWVLLIAVVGLAGAALRTRRPPASA